MEIPSVEGPRVLEAVLEEADKREVQLHRVSQGSGIMLLTDDEILDMCQMAREAGLELSLFVGPRASWETGATAVSGAGGVLGAQHRGQDQLAYALEDVLRGLSLGLRGVLVADAGLLWVLRDLKAKGELPEDLVIKVSVQLAAANAAAVKTMEELGAGTYNVPTDLSLAQLAAIRAATEVPLDVYVEVPDDFGGFVRHYEIPDLVRVASPVVVKFGLRNAPNIYPSGTHL
ncbi:MAG: U32 family peptidase, partial [Rubrobacter sp.]